MGAQGAANGPNMVSTLINTSHSKLCYKICDERKIVGEKLGAPGSAWPMDGGMLS